MYAMERVRRPVTRTLSFCVFLLCAVVLIKLISSTATTGFLTAERPRVPLGIFSLSNLGNTDPDAAALRPDIRADTNRDGVVDITSTSQDSATKAIWTARRGAIFLPNIGDKYYRCRTHDAVGNPLSNDELASCHDASGHLLLAPEYAAPLRTVPMTGVSDAAHARIYATPRAARDRVRIFLLDNPTKPDDTDSWTLVDQEFAFDAARLREGITLRIDGREIVADAAVWDGSVTVRFDVVDGARSVSDEVALKMAPVLTHHNLQAVETIVSTAPDAKHPAQKAFVEKLDAARVAAGIRNPLLLLNQSSDVWAQDFFEPAYASMPGPRGPVAIRVMLRSAQSTRASGRQVFEQLRGPGVGGFQPPSGTDSGFGSREIDSLGNLETIPPYTSRKGVEYKAGRIVVGKHFHREPARVMLDFLRAQGVQTPLMLEAGWLALGHVDEFVQFLPSTNNLGFTIAVADPASGLDILRRARDGGYGDTLAISQTDSHAGHRNPRMTISDALSNLTFIEANEYAQKHIEANLKILLADIPLDGKDVIRIPTLYKDADFVLPTPDDGLPAEITPLVKGERHLVAFSPSAISGVVLGDKYVCSKPWGPMVNGAYAFDKAVEKAYAKAGLTVSYVDDLASHHVAGRGVHSGFNTLRDIRVAWWE